MTLKTGQTEAVRLLTKAMQETCGDAGPAYQILTSARTRLAMTDPDRRALTGPDEAPAPGYATLAPLDPRD